MSMTNRPVEARADPLSVSAYSAHVIYISQHVVCAVAESRCIAVTVT